MVSPTVVSTPRLVSQGRPAHSVWRWTRRLSHRRESAAPALHCWPARVRAKNPLFVAAFPRKHRGPGVARIPWLTTLRPASDHRVSPTVFSVVLAPIRCLSLGHRGYRPGPDCTCSAGSDSAGVGVRAGVVGQMTEETISSGTGRPVYGAQEHHRRFFCHVTSMAFVRWVTTAASRAVPGDIGIQGRAATNHTDYDRRTSLGSE